MDKKQAAHLYAYDIGLECVIQDRYDGFLAGWDACLKHCLANKKTIDVPTGYRIDRVILTNGPSMVEIDMVNFTAVRNEL